MKIRNTSFSYVITSPTGRLGCVRAARPLSQSMRFKKVISQLTLENSVDLVVTSFSFSTGVGGYVCCGKLVKLNSAIILIS